MPWSRPWIDDLIERGLDPEVPRLFIIRALRRRSPRRSGIALGATRQSSAARSTRPGTSWSGYLRSAFSSRVRCARPWELDDAEKAEKLIRNLARRLERDAPGVSASILEGLDEILTVSRLRSSGGLAALARLYQHHRKRDGHRAPCLPQRKALEFGLDGSALDRCSYERSRERISQRSKLTNIFLHCGSRLPLTTKRRQTIALLSKLRRPLNIIHGNDRFTKFNRARGNSAR